MYIKTDKRHSQEINPKINSIVENASLYGFSWLDSSMKIGNKGKKSFLMTNPLADIYLKNDIIHYEQFSDKIQIKISESHIFDLIEKLVHKYDLCAVGYISYESTLEKFGIKNRSDEDIPSIRFLLYEKLNPFSQCDQNIEKQNLSAIIPETSITESISKNEYLSKIRKIKHHIKEGDIYQANFTSRFKVSSPLSPFESYCRLRELNPSPYSAFLNFGDYKILSSSPERMFTIENNQISTCPIKGTIELGDSDERQKSNREKLLNSEKDKAELLMIVDLMRNDLGKISQTGSVNVNSIFEPEVYSSLIHLVSDISATLKVNCSFNDIIDSIIPGGSITGAPKKRAVEIINELENKPRFVYTGSIGYITKDRLDFNIAIRTIYHKDNSYFIHAGGGIVADSNPDDEYNEMLLKARNLFQAVGITHV